MLLLNFLFPHGEATRTGTELFFRAVISGLFVDCLIGVFNVTIRLKIGWTFGVSITAAVLSFAIWKALASKANPYNEKDNLISVTAGSSPL